MGSRRTRLQNITIDYNKLPHIGLWLDKFIVDQNKDSQTKSTLVGEVTAFKEPNDWAYNTYVDNVWKPKLSLSGAKSRHAKVKNRLAINLGSESVLETSISLHRVFGVPFIPGSALKGLVSHFLHHYGGDDWRIGSDNHTVVFGNSDNAGFVTFYDALYVPGSGFNGRPLYSDVMTTHHQDYYGEKRVNGLIPPPADWDSPNPVPFISATGEYLIALSGPNDWVELTFEILGFALAVEGIGAKTSSGYGRMSLADKDGNYTDKYELKYSTQTSNPENIDAASDSTQVSEAGRIAATLIQRIDALRNTEVPGQIGQLASELFEKIEDHAERKPVAEAIIQKVESAKARKAKEKEWFKRIAAISEGVEWVTTDET